MGGWGTNDNGAGNFQGWKSRTRPYNSGMRIAKPMLMITTPIGLAIGLYEGWRLAGGLVFIMGALMLVIAAAFGTVIYTIRKERAEEERKKAAASQPPAPPGTDT